MKATGIVRRVDDLGRIVIPKEIRNMMAIKEGDPVECFVDNDKIVLRKYDIQEDMEQVIDTLQTTVDMKGSFLSPKQHGALMAKVNEMRAILAADNK